MIPAHGWGGLHRAAGARAMVHGAVWAVIGPEGSATAELKPFEGATCAPLTDPQPPADAWRGTAQELLALLAPAIGEHCTACNDAGDIACECCGGKGEFECSNPVCGRMHDCGSCSGSGHETCDCFPQWRGSIVVSRARFVAAQVSPLRGLLHVAGDAPCVMWVAAVPRTDDRKVDERVLFVDVATWRFAVSTTGAAQPDDDSAWDDEVTL